MVHEHNDAPTGRNIQNLLLINLEFNQILHTFVLDIHGVCWREITAAFHFLFLLRFSMQWLPAYYTMMIPCCCCLYSYNLLVQIIVGDGNALQIIQAPKKDGRN